MTNFYSFSGTVTAISDFFTSQSGEIEGCNKLFTVENDDGLIVHFIVSPSTYFIDQETVKIGDKVTGYYDGDLPAILIYPPRYQTIVMVKEYPNRNVKVSYFNHQLLSSDGQLQLHLTPSTPILLTNGQFFSKYPGNRDLVVIYGPTTRSIPAQTTPYRIIVLC
ncbi:MULTISPECIES: hypothetical protein [Ureibacillus]|uniref:hypothetical protein n=1 Tax=Ureibacillus TaxID=160795 RepID=UPI0030C9E54A